ENLEEHGTRRKIEQDRNGSFANKRLLRKTMLALIKDMRNIVRLMNKETLVERNIR
ncbi:596_t:CDS:1, partial [Acaulospora morrowiae]